MSVATELPSQVKPSSDTRKILGPAGNRVRVSEALKRKKEGLKKVEKPRNSVATTPPAVLEKNSSVDSSCSSGSSVERASAKKREKNNKVKPVQVVPEDGEEAETRMLSMVSIPFKRCDWITQYSDPLYTSFHDEEWGVPVHDDRKLFELLIFSQALGELTWPAILTKRETFRKLFENFDPSSIAKFSENQQLSVRPKGGTLLSEQKFRAVVENANQLLKIQQEFGSFSNYCWRFVNHKPIRNGFRYARQVPAKTPKSELISKDLMRRGFHCVGPTVVYSFMQVAGMVNDHLITCSRYIECNNSSQNNLKPALDETKVVVKP